MATAHSMTCGANLCVEDPHQQELRSWYPGEDICSAHGCTDFAWNRSQRKIAKRHAIRPVEGRFTYAMLNGTFRVGSGIRGIDDERTRQGGEEAWIADHHWTAEQVEKAALKGAALRAKSALSGTLSERNDSDEQGGL